MDDSTRRRVVEALGSAVVHLWHEVTSTEAIDLETAEATVRDGMLAIGARWLAAAVAIQGTGKTGTHRRCACGGQAVCEGYRAKQVQTVVGWITMRRAYDRCSACGHGHGPREAALGVARDRLSPGVRRLAGRVGARLPFAEAADSLGEAARVRLSAGTIRTVTEAVGARREQELAAAITAAWAQGLPAAAGVPPARLYVTLDGVRILGTDGGGREVKVGVVQPVRQGAGREQREAASDVAGWAPAAACGPRVALEARRRGVDGAGQIAVLGDGAAWIWQWAAEHFPAATQIVDWFPASERVWDLGRVLFGAETEETRAWVAAQLDHLAAGQVATLILAWQALPVSGAAAAVRDAQLTYFTNQASRMAYDR